MRTALNIAFLAAAAPLLVAAAGDCANFGTACGDDCSKAFKVDCSTFMGTFTQEQFDNTDVCEDDADLNDNVIDCKNKRDNADAITAENFVDSPIFVHKIACCTTDTKCITKFKYLSASNAVSEAIKGQMNDTYASCTSCAIEVEKVADCTKSTCEKVCIDANVVCETFNDAIIAEDEKCKAAIDTSSVKLSNETQTVELDDKCEDKAEWLSCTSKTGICSDCVDVIDGSLLRQRTFPTCLWESRPLATH